MQRQPGLLIRRETLFGDVAIVLFLVAQVLDGAFTYIGIGEWGPRIEANPLLAWLMQQVGDVPALATAKLAASTCGAFLHLAGVHWIVALLTVVYFVGAIVPWTHLLFLAG